jgi:hypothetical protein
VKTVVISGMGKEKAARLAAETAGDRLKVVTMSDYEGVVALKKQEADYFLGICQSGAGGALGLAVAMLSSTRCATVSTAGNAPDAGAIQEAVREGKVAYGFAMDHIERVVPQLVNAILAREA